MEILFILNNKVTQKLASKKGKLYEYYDKSMERP